MPKEELKFRPNEPNEEREWQEAIAKKFGVEHDAEYFIVPTVLKDGTKEIHHVPKHSGSDPRKMGIKGLEEPVLREEMIEAILKIFPEMEKPNFKEAIEILRKRKIPQSP